MPIDYCTMLLKQRSIGFNDTKLFTHYVHTKKQDVCTGLETTLAYIATSLEIRHGHTWSLLEQGTMSLCRSKGRSATRKVSLAWIYLLELALQYSRACISSISHPPKSRGLH